MVAAAGLSVLATLWLTPGPATAQSSRARSARDFVDSIGVVTHLHYDDTVYGRYNDVIKPRLLESGIQHVVDAAHTYPGVSDDGFFYRRVRDLGDVGIDFSLGTSIATARADRTRIGLLDDIQRWSGGAVEMFVGANEPDISGVGDWVERTRSLQRDMWQKVQTDPALDGVEVAGPSPVWRPDSLGDISSWVDYGNWHPYPGGECPTCTDMYGTSFDTRVGAYRTPTGDKPLVFTETGYHNATAGPQDHRPTSETAAGKYVPRLLFEYFNRGVVRSYLYELIDLRSDPARKNRDEHFGLLRNDGSRKPAFVTVRNLIRVLDDPGGTFTPSALDHRITGDTDRVHRTLLQKRDGRFYLALWQERTSYDTGQRANRSDAVDKRGDIAVKVQRVTIHTGGPMKAVKLFWPNQGTSAVRTWSFVDRVTVDVPDEVVLLELTSAAITGPKPGPATSGACDAAPPRVFRDVPRDHVFAAEIDCLAHWNLARGTGSGERYEPMKPVLRWQMAVFLDRLARLEGIEFSQSGGHFDDVDRLSQEARAGIRRMRSRGVARGVTRSSFGPFQKVTRGQIAAFLNRLRTVNGESLAAPDAFTDDEGSVHEPDIDMLAAVGIVRGTGRGRYRPQAQVDRGQMAAMLVRYLHVLVERGFEVTPPAD